MKMSVSLGRSRAAIPRAVGQLGQDHRPWRPPLRIPTIPRSQPGMTWPAPSSRRKRLAPVPGGVELLAGREGHADVVHRERAGLGASALADDDVLLLEPPGRRPVGFSTWGLRLVFFRSPGPARPGAGPAPRSPPRKPPSFSSSPQAAAPRAAASTAREIARRRRTGPRRLVHAHTHAGGFGGGCRALSALSRAERTRRPRRGDAPSQVGDHHLICHTRAQVSSDNCKR